MLEMDIVINRWTECKCIATEADNMIEAYRKGATIKVQQVIAEFNVRVQKLEVRIQHLLLPSVITWN
jgi:hypothetical protein